jgi:RNA polymerase sigma-B factor
MFLTAVCSKESNLNKKNLLKENLYLIGKIVRNFKDISDTQETQETLENVGYIGLLNAVNLYNREENGMDFKSYAQVLITSEIHQYLSDKKYKINQPGWLVSLNQSIDRFVITYQKKHKRFPSMSKISNHININNHGLQEILKCRESVKEVCFIHHLEDNIDEIQPDLENIRSQSYQHFKLPIEDVITLQKAFLKIKELQRNITYYLFVMDLRQTTTAQRLGLSQGRADLIKKDITKHLS